jgi:hypothetical protein
VWGQDKLQQLEQPKHGDQLELGVLKQYMTLANEGLALLQNERVKKTKKPKKGSTGGRPRGGMGEEVIRLAAQMGEKGALRFVQRKHPGSDVKRAYKAARKKPPR